MSGHWRKTVTAAKLTEGLRELRVRLLAGRVADARVAFLCIGTDRSTGDAFGPLVGTLLAEAGYRVVGMLAHPCDATNLTERIAELPSDYAVVAIDASVGAAAQVGAFTLTDGPLQPGRSLGRPLPVVGSVAVTGIVAANRANPYAVLQTASLNAVMGMARQLAEAIGVIFPAGGEIGAAE